MPKYIIRITEQDLTTHHPHLPYVYYLTTNYWGTEDKKDKDVIRLTVCKNNAKFIDAICKHLNIQYCEDFTQDTKIRRTYERVTDD